MLEKVIEVSDRVSQLLLALRTNHSVELAGDRDHLVAVQTF